jgi:diguanylate cyclase (GGDEF)-like protein
MNVKIHRFLSRTNDLLSAADKRATLALALLLVLLLGLLDYRTGFELTLSFFYLLPMALAVWYLGANHGRAIALLCTLTWAVTNRLTGTLIGNGLIRVWNTGERFLIFILFTELLVGLKHALQQEKVLSRTDSLTGISNHRDFRDRATAEILRARRNNRPLTVAFIDLDSFKQINDTLGHAEGDALLHSIAATVSTVIRKTDLFARVGGDEFALLLTETDQEQAKRVMKKIESALAGMTGNAAARVTLSIGVVTFTSAPNSVDELLNKADTLMYGVKMKSKNNIAYRVIENQPDSNVL